MNPPLCDALNDYLAVRRALGYKLARTEKLLCQFLAYLHEQGQARVTTEHALTWAALASGGDAWRAMRLGVVRSFAAYLHSIDPAHEVPAAGLLPDPPHRATPYLYTDAQVTELMNAAGTLRTTHAAATYRTLIGLLAATGMRIGEASGLDREDFDAAAGTLLIRGASSASPGGCHSMRAPRKRLRATYAGRTGRGPRPAQRPYSSPSGELVWGPIPRRGPSRSSSAAPESTPARLRAVPVCMLFATASRSTRSSTPTGQTSTLAPGWRCSPHTWGTSILPTPTGICRRLPS